MYKNLRWKFITILAVLLLSGGLGLYPMVAAHFGVKSPAWLMAYQLRLGLDLQGGLQVILKVQTEDALKAEVQTAADQLQTALKEKNVPVGAVKPVAGQTQFTVEGLAPASEAQFRTIADEQFGQTYDREATGAGAYAFTMKPNVVVNRRAETVTQAVQTLERRVNDIGVSEPWVGPYGTAGDQIMVQLPGLKDMAKAKELMGKTAKLDLKIVESGPTSDEASLLQPHGG
jgi:preprotein translocase subunit SecD